MNQSLNLFRPDFIFSYWIFAWYILYELDIIKYNPKFALSFALTFNIIQIIFMIYCKNSFIVIFIFSLIVILIKGIPLWRLRKTTYDLYQVINTFIFFIIYYVWLYINGLSPYMFYMKVFDQIEKKSLFGPLTLFLNKIL
jgi:hypothetical protein